MQNSKPQTTPPKKPARPTGAQAKANPRPAANGGAKPRAASPQPKPQKAADAEQVLPTSLAQLKARWPAYYRLMRLDRPIGIYLVMWPTLWGLFLAAEGWPQWHNFIIFMLGVVLMRSAGCVINDFADRKVDPHVKRTKERPMATGEVKSKEALALFGVLCGIAFILVLFTNLFTVLLSFGAVALAAVYPFMKRYTHLPQLVLGAAFSWSVLMAYSAETNSLTPVVGLLYITVVIWTLVYDTFYAMVDRDDDLKIGVKSTAILFGEADKAITGGLQLFVVVCLLMMGRQLSLGWPYYLSVLVTCGLFGYQQWLIQDRDRDRCFQAFLNNHWVGMVIFVGIAANYLL